jgi:histone H3/H4
MTDKVIAKKTRHGRNKSRKLFYIPKRNFRNLVREIANQQNNNVDLSWFSQAFDALQTDAEEYLTEKFINASKICDLLETKTLQLKHFLKSNQFQFQLVECRPI